ncbi:MAG: argininosuccinate lyase [Spirochaetales bacterium]|nr:argininosuccinate lyase [Spirochaetales bacterium]
MEKIWQGHLSGKISKAAESFNASISFDKKMYKEDIEGSMAHAEMLGKYGIIEEEKAEKIISALSLILSDIEEGKLEITDEAEDIHSFVESVLIERIGDDGKMLHTARSRNDQVALDTKLYTRKKLESILSLTKGLMKAICEKSKEYEDAVMPGYTHLQRAQPILFSHHLLSYAFMLERDKGRIEDAIKRLNQCPLGSAALAGTTYPIDRAYTAEKLGFTGPNRNSIDGVSDRDYALEAMSALSIEAMHLSRLSEEIVLWSSWEYKFIRLSDNYTTGSSIMPQKRNPDIAELLRGKTGRVYGDMISLFVTMKGLPLAYDKDMQEDKEPLFDSLDTLEASLVCATEMVKEMTVLKDNMMRAAEEGFINATDLADYLTKKGTPFRTSYRISGEIVSWCEKNNTVLSEVPLSKYKEFSPLFEDDLYIAIDLKVCVDKRVSFGGTAKESVEEQINYLTSILEEN